MMYTNTNWSIRSNALYRKFTFKDFVEAFDFMQKVALQAEATNHHPDWRNRYHTVEIELCTHDAGDAITEKDYRLAEAIDGIYADFNVL